jgi:L-cysteine S-thiosulfotransferase
MRRARAVVALSVVLAACASGGDTASVDRRTDEVLRASFREQGIAKLDRLQQDPLQRACSSPEPPNAELAQRLQAAEEAAVRWPAAGFIGDWREGEKLAQNGRGATWTDAPGVPNGGNCYNCHQITRQEVAFGTIGPTLYHYGKLRGVADPASPAAAPVVRYTWAKLWDSKATNVCSAMPRFGRHGLLTESQLRDLMALLLDPKSPVNAD